MNPEEKCTTGPDLMVLAGQVPSEKAIRAWRDWCVRVNPGKEDTVNAIFNCALLGIDKAHDFENVSSKIAARKLREMADSLDSQVVTTRIMVSRDIAGKATDRLRAVLYAANQYAIERCVEYVGTEHLLAALAKEGQGVGCAIMRKLELNLLGILNAVDKASPRGPEMVIVGKLPMTPRAKKALEYAREESEAAKCPYIGTEHLLLGLIRDVDGLAGTILASLDAEVDAARRAIVAYGSVDG